MLLFLAIVQKAENTVAMPVILKTASEVIAMTDEQFNRESRYRVAMCIARTISSYISKKSSASIMIALTTP